MAGQLKHAVVALGGNLGNVTTAFHSALSHLRRSGIQVRTTSRNLLKLIYTPAHNTVSDT